MTRTGVSSSGTTRSGSASPKRRLGRIAAGFNRKARILGRRGVLLWSHLAVKPSECFYCGVHLGIMDGTWDHRVPFDLGGSNEPDNIVRCCYDCNRRKFSKTEAEFAEHKAMWVTCALPGCDVQWKPRYAERKRGMAKYCSRAHAAKSRWV